MAKKCGISINWLWFEVHAGITYVQFERLQTASMQVLGSAATDAKQNSLPFLTGVEENTGNTSIR